MNDLEEIVYNNLKYNLYKNVQYENGNLLVDKTPILVVEYTKSKPISYYSYMLKQYPCIILAIIARDSTIVYYELGPYEPSSPTDH
jgi:hypothetical protein